jgi:hypothetical protein
LPSESEGLLTWKPKFRRGGFDNDSLSFPERKCHIQDSLFELFEMSISNDMYYLQLLRLILCMKEEMCHKVLDSLTSRLCQPPLQNCAFRVNISLRFARQ